LFEQALEKCPPKSCKPIFLLYAQLEEDHGLAKRAMNIYDRATLVVENQDKFDVSASCQSSGKFERCLMDGWSFFKMFTVYIAKVAANFGLTATRPIYERALEVLPDRQTANMCLRFAALERKLGEIDRARAIYAHASQFCDPRTNPEFWAEWHTFEIDTGSEDTFREMLRIKRSVQAQFNTEASYLAAQALTASQGAAKIAEEEVELDPMATAERQTGGGKAGPTFVSAKQQPAQPKGDDEQAPSPQVAGNADEIQISDEDI
jgi:pre-mRNA-splicing factor SYF1